LKNLHFNIRAKKKEKKMSLTPFEDSLVGCTILSIGTKFINEGTFYKFFLTKLIYILLKLFLAFLPI